jgi:hypothetical protein
MSAADTVTAGRIVPTEAIAAAGLPQYQGGGEPVPAKSAATTPFKMILVMMRG